MKYSLIYADPPWAYKDTANAGKRGAGHKYPTMKIQDLIGMRSQIDDLADKNCALAMWATFPTLLDAFALLQAWGFKYRTVAFVWVKTNPGAGGKYIQAFYTAAERLGFGRRPKVAHNMAVDVMSYLMEDSIQLVSLFWGMGHWTRSNAEIVILGTRGKVARASAGVHSVILAPIGEHSAKPPETRDRLVTLLGDVPRIELFARQRAPGWDAHGNQLPGAPADEVAAHG